MQFWRQRHEQKQNPTVASTEAYLELMLLPTLLKHLHYAAAINWEHPINYYITFLENFKKIISNPHLLVIIRFDH